MVGRGSECNNVALRVRLLPSYRTRSATLPRSEPLPTTTTGHYTICCKKKTSVLRSWRWAKVCPKHVELILEINKTVIVASRWFPHYLVVLTFWFYAEDGNTMLLRNVAAFSLNQMVWHTRKRLRANVNDCGVCDWPGLRFALGKDCHPLLVTTHRCIPVKYTLD